MSVPTFVDRKADIKTIDQKVKNKFRWNWLEEKDEHGDFLSDYIRKTSGAGTAFCVYCKQTLNYGSKGKQIIMRHAVSATHVKRRRELQTNQSLPSVFKNIKHQC